MSLTAQQQKAVESHGKTIVSAAAGSGKTHVMVTRFVRLITEEHADVRSMLAVTFTNKAAAQMRERIRKALLEGIATSSGEEREFLSAQLKNLPLADICTIHAYCGRLLRTFFYLVGIDPSFRIVGGEDAECTALSGRAMDRVFEDAYDGNVQGFEELLAVFFRKKDENLKKLVLDVYEKVRSDAHYRDVLQTIAEGREDTFDEAAEFLRREYARRIARCLDELHSVAKFLPGLHSDKIDAYYASLEQVLLDASGAPDLFEMARRIAVTPEGSLSDKNVTDPVELHVISTLKRVRSKERLAGLRDMIKGYHDRDAEREKYESSQKQAASLATLTLAYDEAFTAVKREAGVLDYEDLEHLAIALLGHEEVRDFLRQKYAYVFVDEYQDVNPMQEEIISLLAGSDVFLVGDLKQAIYAFRGSKSVFFAQKEKQFSETGNCLTLSANFRSAHAILDAVNTVFSVALKNYPNLDGGELYGSYEGEVILHDLESEETEDAGERKVYSVKEAAAAAKTNATAERVAAIVEEECGTQPGLGRQFYDTDLKQLREVSYGDIAVLVRKNKETAAAVVRALAERGIPVTAEAKINICDYFEVRLLLDWLSFLDNPEQDIPMASAMLSVLGMFNDDELAAIRLFADRAGVKGSFRAACRAYAALCGPDDPLGAKFAAFERRAERYRDLMCVRSASEMLAVLLADGLEAQIAAKGESEVRLGRVRKLIAESAGCDDVHSFLARLRDCDYEVDLSEAGGENAVHVLTMHASKGLEFPVVILIDLDDKIRGLDMRKDLLWTDKFHIVLRAYDLEKKIYRDTILRQASKEYAMQEAIGGELNLLYVAMTRARCRLHMVFAGGAPAYATAEEELANYSVPDAVCLSDFIPRLSLHASAENISPHALPASVTAPLYRPVPSEVERIREATRPYAHPESACIPVKDSATGLLGRKEAPMYREETEETEPPMSEMSTEDAGMGTGYSPDVGTAYHAFLEHVTFGEDPEKELARMREGGVLTPEQLALLDPERLKRILSMPVFDRVKGKKTYREQRFLARFPASEFSSSYGVEAQDEVLYQGAIDLLVDEGEGRYTIVDYKFSSLGADKLLAHYAVQLHLYRLTVARVMKTDLAHVAVYLVNIARGYEVACP